jgi:hypothetical protein
MFGGGPDPVDDLLGRVPAWFWTALGPTAVALMVAVAGVVLARSLHRFYRGDGPTRARRRVAILSGPVSDGVPFALAGVARGNRVALHIDLDFTAAWQDVTAALGESGVTMELDVMIGGRVLPLSKLRLPRDRMPRDAKGRPELMEVSSLVGGGHVRCTCLIAELGEIPSGTEVRVTGRMAALPENRVGPSCVWVG